MVGSCWLLRRPRIPPSVCMRSQSPHSSVRIPGRIRLEPSRLNELQRNAQRDPGFNTNPRSRACSAGPLDSSSLGSVVVAHWLRWKAVLVGVEVPASGRVQHAWGACPLSTASLRPPQNPTLPCHRPSLSTLHLPARSPTREPARRFFSLVAAPPVPSLSSHNPVISSTPRLSRPSSPLPPPTQDQVPFTYPPEFPATGFPFFSFFSPLPSHSFATPIDNGSRLAQGSWLESFRHRQLDATETPQHPPRRRRRHDSGATTTTSSWLDDRFSFFLSSRTPPDKHPSSFVQPMSIPSNNPTREPSSDQEALRVLWPKPAKHSSTSSHRIGISRAHCRRETRIPIAPASPTSLCALDWRELSIDLTSPRRTPGYCSIPSWSAEHRRQFHARDPDHEAASNAELDAQSLLSDSTLSLGSVYDPFMTRPHSR